MYMKHVFQYRHWSQVTELQKPWLTTAIKNYIQHKNVMYQKPIKKPSLENVNFYKKVTHYSIC